MKRASRARFFVGGSDLLWIWARDVAGVVNALLDLLLAGEPRVQTGCHLVPNDENGRERANVKRGDHLPGRLQIDSLHRDVWIRLQELVKSIIHLVADVAVVGAKLQQNEWFAEYMCVEVGAVSDDGHDSL